MISKQKVNQTVATLAMLYAGCFTMSPGVLKGLVLDSSTGEPLVGATVLIEKTGMGAVTDVDGRYSVNVPDGVYDVLARYLGYQENRRPSVAVTNDTTAMDFVMVPDSNTLQEVSVTAIARRDSEVAQVQEQKNSSVVQNGVSAQEIQKTQDKDASEVIKRIPGISVIDDKFVMVRGLSQRYNNVWLNGSAVPGSEADSRSFSFDIIPSSQLDNMVIIKSPAPEYPADFTGGFVLVNTKRQPASRGFDISLGLGFNDRTHFREFVKADGKPSRLSGGMNAAMHHYLGFPGERIDPVASGFDNNWRVKTIRPLGDMKLNASYSQTWNPDGGQLFGLLAAVNFSNTYRTQLDMENSLYGPYDVANNKAVPLRKADDNQYTHDMRLGAMLNLSFRPRDDRHFFEWKNVFNTTVKDRYSERTGFNAQSDNINDMEYYRSSRPTVNTQFTGSHNIDSDHVDWSVGYAFAQKDMPDRRLIQRTDRTEETMGIYRIGREFTRLDEHTASVAGNYRHEFGFAALRPVLKAGLYGEFRTRTYRARQFQYGWQPQNTLPPGFMFDPDVQTDLLVEDNYGPDKLYMYEEVNYLNNYNARQGLGAGYAGVSMAWRRLDAYAGVRYEFCRQTLEMNTRQFEQSLQSTDYDHSDFFPSVNLTYHLTESHQLRAAFGRSVNRPEFRELSSSVFYDFDLGSSVMGNPDLKPAYIDNLDLRWEWYPSKGEQVSVALFYKHFSNPIEWTYTVAGGTDLIYSFVNAKGADNYGIEVDVRKNLGFMGLRDFSLSFNGALIRSRVRFDKGSSNIDRPMQGQSPYLVNAGLFYSNPEHGWNASVLYNCIGKRIVGVGNRYGTASDGTARNIPNSYEMPRHSLDISVGKRFGRWSVRFSARDVLAQRCLFKQMEEVVQEGRGKTIEEVTRSYRPGRNFNIAIGYNF